ncbi:MAG: N-acetyltransferase family protein [Polyangiales bacterium]
MIVRPATLDDVASIAAGNVAIARETEGVTLHEDLVHMGVEAVIDDPEKGRFFVAEHEGKIVGQLLLTREWSDWNARWHVWIQSVYVVSPMRRRGVYRLLHERAVSEARALNAITVRLYVERENTVAQKTYAAMGMKRARYDVFELHLEGSRSDGRP